MADTDENSETPEPGQEPIQPLPQPGKAPEASAPKPSAPKAAPPAPKGIAERHLEELCKLERLTQPSFELRAVKQAMEQEEQIRRLLEPPPWVKVLQESEEREQMLQRMQGHTMLPHVDSALDALKHLELSTSIAREFAASQSSVLEAVRAHELIQGDLRKYAQSLALLDVNDYRRPDIFQSRDVLESLSHGAVSVWMRQHEEMQSGVVAFVEQERIRAEQVASAIEAIEAPWIRVAREQQSVWAMVELSSIGTALKHVHPFDSGFAASLRADFGDWRLAPAIDPAALRTPAARSQYYAERGLDRSLTDFNDAAFAEGLSASDLCDNYLEGVDLEALAAGNIDAKTEAALRQNTICQVQVTQLEAVMRDFIERRMEKEFGPKWAKQKLDARMYAEWLDKQEKAKKAGRPMGRLIEAADFTDYSLIICKKDIFPTAFKPHFRDENYVRESFARLQPLRLDAMHSRPMSNDDILYVVVEVKRLIAGARLTP
jgi:hypothetical protein